MSDEIHFETPENIRVAYRVAGPGTRFVAWVVDNILLWVISIVVAIPLLVVFGAALEVFIRDRLEPGPSPERPLTAVMYVLGLWWLFFSLGGLLYFGLSELLLRGQTIGKRQVGIRVVKADGFALDPLSIFVRTLFRIVDHLPPLWLVPIFTQRSQRLGDLVAGTVVVSDQRAEYAGVRDLANRKYADCRFHFDATMLARARRQDVEAIERILDRWDTVRTADRAALLERLVRPLAARLQVDCPAAADQHRFLEDFLSAEYRRQHRKLN